MKNVLVTGDLILDQYLIKEARPPASYSAPLATVLAHELHGGAWYLRELVATICADVSNVFGPIRTKVNSDHVAHAHSVWAQFPQFHDHKKKLVWRIRDFLGCELCKQPMTDDELKVVAGESITDPLNLVVLEDMHLGFADDERQWPAAVRAKSSAVEILLKLNAAPRTNKLWEQLLNCHADRTTVVMSVNALRERGATLSYGLSWDQTIEDLAAEFATGPSAYDLARFRRVVVYFPDGAAAAFFNRKETVDSGKPEFEPLATLNRFLYLPDEVEGHLLERIDGKLFGMGSLIAAAMARHLIAPTSYPVYLALGRALSAGRALLAEGGALAKSDSRISLDQAAISSTLLFDAAQVDSSGGGAAKDSNKSRNHSTDPAFAYYTAYRHDLFDNELLRSQPATESNLLRDVAGPNVDYMKAKAFEVVEMGAECALKAVPKARYGKYLTVDREEIERINGVRRLIQEYRRKADDKRPLSIAVFGQPGSGKSFAIKQLGESLFGEKNPVLEFNLSQFGGDVMHQLHQAFHRVRDASIEGNIPLVFWDEFDADNLKWLQHFLAPMQDCQFRSGSDVHMFGKAIFVFAGGTATSFKEFDQSASTEADKRKEFKALKGPDFVSRLRGYIDIKGPNPAGSPDQDPAYVIRRAVILRSALERFYGDLITRSSNDTGTEPLWAQVDSAVIHAFLNVQEFRHGARSLETTLAMSRLKGASYFDVSRLGPRSLLAMHLSDDFFGHLQAANVTHELAWAVAERAHADWRAKTEAKIAKKPPTPAEASKLTHLLKDFQKLSVPNQLLNVAVARTATAKLAEIRLEVRRIAPHATSAGVKFTDDDRRRLARSEHDRWMREQLIQGSEYATATNKSLRLHVNLVRFDDLSEEDKKLDEALSDQLPDLLSQHHLELLPQGAPDKPAKPPA